MGHVHWQRSLSGGCGLLLAMLLGTATSAERPDGLEIQQRMTVQLKSMPVREGLLLRWHPANQAPSDGIKIVASTSHQQPVHGHGLDPVLAWIGGTGQQETVISYHDLMRLSQGQPLALRLCFVREGAHDDPRAHLAYSNVVVHAGPAHEQDKDKDKGRAERSHLKLRPRLPEPTAWKPAEKPDAQAKDRSEGSIKHPLRQRIEDKILQRQAKLSPVPPPAELERTDLAPGERELLTRIHSLEQRKHDLEALLSQLEAQGR